MIWTAEKYTCQKSFQFKAPEDSRGPNSIKQAKNVIVKSSKPRPQ